MKKYESVFKEQRDIWDWYAVEFYSKQDMDKFVKIMKKEGLDREWKGFSGEPEVGFVVRFGAEIAKDVYEQFISLMNKYNIKWEEL